MVVRPPAGTIPDTPGSYQFIDGEGRIIYVGKAKSLRSRLGNYFQNPEKMHPRTAQMVSVAETVTWVQVANDVEALMLEFNLIKQHRPRFNVRLVDDKSYPYLALTLSDEWPRAHVTRGKKRKGVRYFGPYAHAYAIRSTVDLLLKSFPLRSCSNGKLARHKKMGKPCLLYHIKKCSGPCIGAVSQEKYSEMIGDFAAFLEGDTEAITTKLSQDMQEAATNLEFERAARLRDRLQAVTQSSEKQQMVAERNENFDVLGVAQDDLEISVYVFFVRHGRVIAQKSFILDKIEECSSAEYIDRILEGLYSEDIEHGIPTTVLVPELVSDLSLYQEWLTLCRGSAVHIRVPQRGEKVRLQKTVTENAKEQFRRHRLKRASDHNSRAKALHELQNCLALKDAPLRIECFDMSHMQGSHYVGSMVVVEDGVANHREYRRFKVETVDQSDDYASMEEVLTRRFQRYVDDRERPVAERGKFQYPPNLLVVDGGKGQLSVAVRVLDSFGLRSEIAVCSIAKRLEEVFLPEQKDPVIVPRDSEALYLLQRLRDESHRFAIEYHRKLRDKAMTKSELDDISGLGPARKKRLLEEFGDIKKVKRASLESLQNISWLPTSVADAVYSKFH